jgi:hypothetical protein
VQNPQVVEMIEKKKLVPTEQLASLRGVSDKLPVYQIP